MLVTPLMTNWSWLLEMTAVSACYFPPRISPPPSIKALTHYFWVGGRPLDRCLPPSPPVVGIWSKTNFPFHQPGLLIGFWSVSSWTPHAYLSVTIAPARIWERSKGERRLQAIWPTNLQESFWLDPSWLSDVHATSKDPKSYWSEITWKLTPSP